MARVVFMLLCVAAVISGARLESVSPASYGMSMATRAYDAVCWYEALKVFPDTQSDHYCAGTVGAKAIQNQIEHPDEESKKYYESYPEALTTQYGVFLTDMGTMNLIPSASFYKEKCEKYLKDPNAESESNESDALNDQATSPYPYRAFAYCMMAALRGRHGQQALEDVKNERTHTIKEWRQTFLDRDNEFRKRHGAPPLQRMPELDAAAQQFAEESAHECHAHHSPGETRQLNGDTTGENYCSGQGDDDPAAVAYMCSDGWYAEISYYPYPDGFQGSYDDFNHWGDTRPGFGHFSQTVWNSTQYVGYGYAYSCGNYFVIGRYYPGGNVIGAFSQNVSPPLF